MFTHLHLHTKYSLLDATIKIDELMKKLQELGQTSVAITDHGNMYGVVEFYKEAINNNIKPIVGCEMYVCSDVSIMKRDNKMYHLILLCKNEVGRQNLQKLVSESTKYKFNKRPRIDFNMLQLYHEGLICMSACMVGEVAMALRENNKNLALEIAKKYKSLFNDDYYIEYQAHCDDLQQKLNCQLIEVAEILNIKYVVTCDAHYLIKDDQKYHDIFVQIGQSRETGETYNDCYLQSEDEVINNCQSTEKYNAQAIQNTQEIVAKCNVDYPLSAPIIPHVQIPPQFKTEEQYLKTLCNNGMKKKGFNNWTLDQWKSYLTETVVDKNGNTITREVIHFNTVEEILKIYKNRAQYEMESVLKMGFEGYYLLVHSYISAAKKRGIARGSAGGSLLAYLSGIVDIDPIKYGLYFERFIDVGALELLDKGQISKKELKIPDVDADFSTDDRSKVMHFIVDKYKQENVVALGQFGYLWAKGAIKDIGKVLGIPFDITNEITKQLNDETIDEALSNGILDKYKEQYPKLFEYASKIAGLPKSHGMHPCGKVIAMRNANYYNAVEYDADNESWVLEGDMHTADDLGLVKIDLLGLRTLNVIYDTLDMIGETYDYIAPHKINLCDQTVWKEFEEGNTSEIFQFESPGMRRTLKEMFCNSIENLSAANALYRPGSKEYIPMYIARRNGEEGITYVNDDLKPILSTTYGIIIYQEQLIEIGRMAGLSNPDELRKATAKKKPKLMAKIEPELKNGLINKGWTQEEVDILWNNILKFAKYSFNKAHSAAYGLTAYITMYLKVHHPYEFITATINSYDGSTKDIIPVLQEATRLGVKYKYKNYYEIPPTTIYNPKDGYISLGINTVKGLGSSISDQLKLLHNDNINTFVDLLAFNQENKCIDKKTIDFLVKLNFFSEFGEPNALLEQVLIFDKIYGKKQFKIDKITEMGFSVDDFVNYATKTTDKVIKFEDTMPLLKHLVSVATYPKTTKYDKLCYEWQYLGYIQTVLPKMNKDYYFVTGIKGKQSRMVTVYQIRTGQSTTYKIRKKLFDTNPIEEGQCIHIKEFTNDFKWRKVIDENGKDKWEQTGEHEMLITKYSVLTKEGA